jgi:hypothetical protein
MDFVQAVISFVLGALGAVPVLVIYTLFANRERRRLVEMARALANTTVPEGGPLVPSGPVTDALVARVIADTKASVGRALLDALGGSR